MPKILIDEGLTSYGKMSGIGYHIVNLAEHLKKITECKITKYEILRKIPRYFRKWAYIGVSNIADLYSNYDLVHHMANYIPLIRGKNKHIVTIYDLSILRYQETISLAWRHYNQIALKNAIKRADGIITISRSIADELLESFPGLDENNIYVCPTGLREELRVCRPKEEYIHQLNIKPFSYILFVGDLTKRKNLKFLLNVFIEAKKKQIIDKTTDLILVGKHAWGYVEIKPLILENIGIREVGYLSDEQIAALYRFSKAFVFPSIYEGFGMPIVEAMNQGAPIIVSNIPTSIELNINHNNQMLQFNLGDAEKLTQLLQMVDKNWQSIRSQINYGDLSRYHYSNIAKRHMEIYSVITKMI
jgi:glycosyltransferase involved in cell wall biosynthesis